MMTYFEKIEAYFSGEMSEMEQFIFEQTLEDNAALQKEYEAYKTAQSLFNFTAETLSEEEITTAHATETVEQLINFTAQNLSEKEILSSTEVKTIQTQVVVRNISSRRDRIEWLVAASMLFVLSLIGAQFYNNPTTETIQTPTELVVEKEVQPKIEKPVKKEKVIPAPVVSEPITKIVKKVAKKRPIPKYEPAKVRITPKTQPVVNPNHIATVDKDQMGAAEVTPNVSNPLALLTSAERIVTGKVINKGETIVYKAGNSITLKPGFHAKAGANFVATPNATEETAVDLTKSEIIDNQESKKYNATNSITLKAGFHAKAGSAFVATTTNSSASSFVSTNAIISEKEAVVVKADKGITLKAGFHAKAGADFVAKIKN